MEGEDDQALEGLPVEQAMVVLEQPELEKEESEDIPIPPNAPPYEAIGKIQQPSPNSGDAATFGSAILSIKTGAQDFDTSLDDLSDLAHDIYYGVEICKDQPTVEKLLCYTLGLGSEKFPARENKRDYKAASVLAAAIQNNPTALNEVTAFSRGVWYPKCGSGKPSGSGHVVEFLTHTLASEQEPSALKAKLVLLNGLMKDPTVRDDFLQAGAMKFLLSIWLKEGEQWDAARRKVAQLILDTFLDEEMGAELKTWPKEPALKSKVCESKDRRLDDGCWEHHLENFLKASPKSYWAKNFLDSLREHRAKVVEPLSHVEL